MWEELTSKLAKIATELPFTLISFPVSRGQHWGVFYAIDFKHNTKRVD